MRWLLLAFLGLASCQATQEGSSYPFLQSVAESPPSEMAQALSPLRFSGTILILTGSVLLFVTQGRRGWIPILLGVGLTVLMAILATVLDSQIFIYSLMVLLCIVAAVAAWNLKEFRTWIKYSHSFPSPLDTLSPSRSEPGLGDPSSKP